MAISYRSCVICGLKAHKSELTRYVWGGAEPEKDQTGSAQGRGAYICTAQKCWNEFIQRKKKWKRVFRL